MRPIITVFVKSTPFIGTIPKTLEYQANQAMYGFFRGFWPVFVEFQNPTYDHYLTAVRDLRVRAVG
jgi:hypothetical protein